MRVLAYHLIITAYGFWLPNDPRGSWSEFVRAWELLRFGRATKTTEKRSVARKTHDRALRLEAKRSLARPPVLFDGRQALAIAQGFANYVRRSDCVLWACAIMPDHVHAVVARHRYSIEQVSNLMKGAASASLTKAGIHPFRDSAYRDATVPTPWSRGEWSVYLYDDVGIRRAIDYVNQNPTREGFKAQHWKFVKAYGLA